MSFNRQIASGRAMLAAEVVGSGDPVVFLHAGVCDRRMWRAQLDGVGANNKAIAYDRRLTRRVRQTLLKPAEVECSGLKPCLPSPVEAVRQTNPKRTLGKSAPDRPEARRPSTQNS